MGRITTEMACAVAHVPFARARQYLKRGQFRRSAPDGFNHLDVLRLTVFRELTDCGITASRASAIAMDISSVDTGISLQLSPCVFLTVDLVAINDKVIRGLAALA